VQYISLREDETLNIIRANFTHLDQVAPLFDGYRVYYAQTTDIESSKEFIRQRIVLQDSVIFLAVDDNGKGLGFTQLYPTLSSVSMGRVWILNDLFVHPDARKQGVGRLLLERAKQFGIEHGALRLQLSTELTNSSAQSLYESLGWQRDEEFYHYSLSLI
jgi:GNAT superfamily N-acetyltransferase